MAGAHCATCDAPIENGAHCPACAGNASTLIASAAVNTLAAKPARKHGDPLIGVEVIGQYIIRSQLGKGGMGAVYLADQPSVGRRAVIKVLHPRLSGDPEIKSRFETEARAASQLNHSNIVTIYNYGAMADGTLFLAMEHIDGQTLAQATAKKRLPLSRVVNIVSQIANALGEAHRRGVVHRDIKPTNVMLVEREEQDDFVKVLDFGIAHIDGTRVTATGDLCGTPTYMSPEQIRGKDVDGRSDLYSLGCLLFELLTGEVPFEGDTTLVLAYKHAHEEPRPPSTVVPKAKLPPALDGFVARALAKDPTARPRDAAAFRDELRAAVGSEPVRELESKPIARVAKESATADATVTNRVAKADSKPTPRPRARAESRPAPQRKAPSTGLLARAGAGIRARFRRRQSLAERLATRVRIFGKRTRRPRKRWPWIILVSVIAVSLLGVGWYVLARHKKATHESRQPAKSAPSTTVPPRPPAKPAGQSGRKHPAS